jgi:hypothetical protein
MKSIKKLSWLSGTIVPPAIALVVLVALPRIGTQSEEERQAIATRNAEVAEAFAETPYLLGDWIGRDIPIPESAWELLRPNAMLGRALRRSEDGAEVNLLIVHCSDARDMDGHYPPICYPSNGWSKDARNAERDRLIDCSGRSVRMKVYEFQRTDKLGTTRQLRVFNYFILPSGEITSAMADVRRIADRVSLSTQGVAQVQLTMTGRMSLEDSAKAVADVLGELSPLLTTLGQGD